MIFSIAEGKKTQNYKCVINVHTCSYKITMKFVSNLILVHCAVPFVSVYIVLYSSPLPRWFQLFQGGKDDNGTESTTCNYI